MFHKTKAEVKSIVTERNGTLLTKYGAEVDVISAAIELDGATSSDELAECTVTLTPAYVNGTTSDPYKATNQRSGRL